MFAEYWDDRKPGVMAFNAVKNEFVDLLQKYLKKAKANLASDVELGALTASR